MTARTVIILLAIAIVAISGFVWFNIGTDRPASNTGNAAGRPTVEVKLPSSYSAAAQDGMILFNRECAECHGENAAGTESGPPLVHRIYEPGHHGDAAFYVAARNGVRAHHWNFGNMPPRPDVTEPEMAAIVTYVRELQQANGIF